jgi:hypothetical protein
MLITRSGADSVDARAAEHRNVDEMGEAECGGER